MKKHIGRVLSILHRQSQIYFTHALKEFNLTSAEYPFLMYLYKQDGITQDNLSSYLYIDKAATARSIKSLEQKGYITRSKDTKDKRCNHVYLTPLAKETSEDIKKRVFHWSELLTEGMDIESTDLIYCMLETMVTKVEQMNFKTETED
ncbi:MAG: MarR family winged helix-turn-helix transcriptional regulator [Velocimicrobium sp.]